MGAESTGPVAGFLVCRRNTSDPPARQAPMTHGARFVSPSRLSGWETAWSASGGGGILAGAAGAGVGCEMAPWPPEAAREVVLLALSFGTPGCHFLWILNFLRNPFHWRTLYRLLCRLLILLLRLLHRIFQQGSSVQIGSASRWSARRLAVLSTCRSGVELAGSTAKRVSDKRVALEV